MKNSVLISISLIACENEEVYLSQWHFFWSLTLFFTVSHNIFNLVKFCWFSSYWIKKTYSTWNNCFSFITNNGWNKTLLSAQRSSPASDPSANSGPRRPAPRASAHPLLSPHKNALNEGGRGVDREGLSPRASFLEPSNKWKILLFQGRKTEMFA